MPVEMGNLDLRVLAELLTYQGESHQGESHQVRQIAAAVGRDVPVVFDSVLYLCSLGLATHEGFAQKTLRPTCRIEWFEEPSR